ncbi:hypothetical protein GCM10007389_17240 [Pontibacter akesuensis]|nr:hypothetical protein GCM10007389_17240 [Pontibacter akesuensis]
MAGYSQAQSGSAVTIFKETVGNAPIDDYALIPDYNAAANFDNDNLSFSGDGIVWEYDVSTGYSGASGGNNISLFDTEQFVISGINTAKYISQSLSFGVFKESTVVPVVEYSVDGQNWTQLTVGAVGNETWQLITLTEDVNKNPIPSVSNLSLRFRGVSNNGGLILFDDFELKGQVEPSSDPVVSSFSPTFGGEGTIVTFYGENLQNTTSVNLGRNSTELISATANEVKVRIKSGITSTFKLTIGSVSVTTVEKFTFIRPSVTYITNSQGVTITEAKQGETITLHGTDLGSTYSVSFGGVTAVPISTSATSVTVVVPEGAVTSKLTVYTNMYGLGYSDVILTILKPTITSLSRTSGRINDGVIINGTRLNIGTYKVYFSGSEAPVEAVISAANADGTSLTVSVPVGAIDGPITVTTDEGTATSQAFDVAIPEIIITGTQEPFSTTVGVASDPQYYTMSGNNLGGGVSMSAPTNFEISVSGENGPWVRGHFFPLEQDGGVSQKLIYVRYVPTSQGSHSGDIVHSSDGVIKNQYVVGNATAAAPLPVEFISFTAAVQSNGVALKWSTASETNNSHFEVEMAVNQKDGFTKVGQVESKVTNSSTKVDYAFIHSLNTSGIRYYRLKQVDLDGTFEYSKVVAVNLESSTSELQVLVSPNPINYNTKVFVTAEEAGEARLVLHSISGQQVYTKSEMLHGGQNEVQLPVYDKLSSGMYVLTVEINGQVRQVRVVKQ